jgi:hypothetical protein
MRARGKATVLLILNAVQLDLRVERGWFDVQQLRRPGLMSACLIEGESDQPCLKALDFVVEIDARGKIQRLQAVGYVRESFVASEMLRLSQQRGREIAKMLRFRTGCSAILSGRGAAANDS